MLPSEYLRLPDFLTSFRPRKFSAVVMPDFFLDRFICYKRDFERLSSEVLDIAGRKGGSIDNIRQLDIRGGNAANTAAALAILGAKVFPLIHTSPLGLDLLKFYLQPYDLDLSHVKSDGETSITTALEFLYRNEKVNVMLRDLGSLPNFGPADLISRDYQILAEADYVCIFNWAGTRKYGTELAGAVFRYVKTSGKAKTYYDTADPTPNRDKIPILMKRVLQTDLVDILSLNENEAIVYASQLEPEKLNALEKQHKKPDRLALDSAKILSNHLSARIDIHTTAFSATFTKNKKPTIISTVKVPVKRVTGAGDSWNAANIYSYANNLPDKSRLAFANAFAAYYIASQKTEHPTLNKLIEFISKKSLGLCRANKK
jgi:ribokinase